MRPMVTFLFVFTFCAIAKRISSLESFDDRTQLPLQLNIWLLSQGSDNFVTTELKKSLENVFPSYLPEATSEIEFDISYNILTKEKKILHAYKSIFQSTDMDEPGTYSVLASSMSRFLEKLRKDSDEELMSTGEQAAAAASLSALPIVIVLPNDILPPHKIRSDDADICSQTFVEDMLFVDLSATACDMSEMVVGGGSTFSALPVPPGSSAGDVWFDSFASTSARMPHESKVYLLARISNVVTAAIKQFAVSTVTYRATHSAGKILCPVVFLTSKTSSGDTKEDEKEDLLSHVSLSTEDTSFLTSWMESFLLPHQEVHIFSATHYVEDHPQLALALAAAARSFPATDRDGGRGQEEEEVVYLDSDNLLSELSKTGDSLTQRLLLDAGHGLDDDLMLEVEALFQHFRSGGKGKDESQLERWMVENDPHNYAREPKDGLLSQRYTASHERTKIVPVFVLSDLFALQAEVDEISQRIITKVPLFDHSHLVSCRQNVALVMHSSAYNTHIFDSPPGDLHQSFGSGKGWREVDLSDPTLLIAEGLAGSLAGLRSPHFRTAQQLQHQWEGVEEVDLTWGLGRHPFSPFHHVRVRGRSEQLHFSTVLSWASRRAGVLARANAALHRLQGLLDRGVLFVKDLNRFLELVYEVKPRGEGADAPPATNDEAIEKFLSKVFIFDFDSSSGGEQEGKNVHMEEMAGLVAEHRVLFGAVLQRLLDVKAAVFEAVSESTDNVGRQAVLLQTLADELARAEADEVPSFRDKLEDNERAVRELLGRCEFVAREGAGASSRSGGSRVFTGLQIGKILGFGVGFICFVFGMKKMQERLELRAKKTA